MGKYYVCKKCGHIQEVDSLCVACSGKTRALTTNEIKEYDEKTFTKAMNKLK